MSARAEEVRRSSAPEDVRRLEADPERFIKLMGEREYAATLAAAKAALP